MFEKNKYKFELNSLTFEGNSSSEWGNLPIHIAHRKNLELSKDRAFKAMDYCIGALSYRQRKLYIDKFNLKVNKPKRRMGSPCVKKNRNVIIKFNIRPPNKKYANRLKGEKHEESH